MLPLIQVELAVLDFSARCELQRLLKLGVGINILLTSELRAQEDEKYIQENAQVFYFTWVVKRGQNVPTSVPRLELDQKAPAFLFSHTLKIC